MRELPRRIFALEPIARVELTNFNQRHLVDASAPVRRATHGRVVHDDDLSVDGGTQIHLERVDAELFGFRESVERVLGQRLPPPWCAIAHGSGASKNTWSGSCW